MQQLKYSMGCTQILKNILHSTEADLGPCIFRPFDFDPNKKIENWISIFQFSIFVQEWKLKISRFPIDVNKGDLKNKIEISYFCFLHKKIN